jgi:hypothetical protein
MAFTEKFLPYATAKQNFFYFYATGDGAVASMDEDLQPDCDFVLDHIKFQFSDVCSADIYLRLYANPAYGSTSGYLHSYALSNSTWYLFTPSGNLTFLSGDKINISCVTDNKYSIVACGWCVTQPVT